MMRWHSREAKNFSDPAKFRRYLGQPLFWRLFFLYILFLQKTQQRQQENLGFNAGALHADIFHTLTGEKTKHEAEYEDQEQNDWLTDKELRWSVHGRDDIAALYWFVDWFGEDVYTWGLIDWLHLFNDCWAVLMPYDDECSVSIAGSDATDCYFWIVGRAYWGSFEVFLFSLFYSSCRNYFFS